MIKLLEFLQSLYLETNYDAFNADLALIVAIVTVIGLAITVFFSIRESRQSQIIQYTDIVTSLGNALDEQLQDEYSLETRHDCEIYAEMYLDKLDRIAYLAIKEKLPKYAPTYFRKYFRYGKTLFDWYKENVQDQAPLDDHWDFLQAWITKQGIQGYDSVYLPPQMREFSSKSTNSDTK